MEPGRTRVIRGRDVALPRARWVTLRVAVAMMAMFVAGNDPENTPIILVEASHVVIDGFLFDGNNPEPPMDFGPGYNANGVEVYAAAAVQNGCYPDFLDVDHITIRNNIIRN